MSGANKGDGTAVSVGTQKLVIECGDMSFEPEKKLGKEVDWIGGWDYRSTPVDLISFRGGTTANAEGSIAVTTST